MGTQPDTPPTIIQLADELDAINCETQLKKPNSKQVVAKILADHKEKCLKLDRVGQITGSVDR